MKFNVVENLNESIINEDEIGAAVDKEAEAAAKPVADAIDADVVEHKSQIEKMLDRSLKVAKTQQKHPEKFKGSYPNLLFIGEAGTGKTSIVRQWAEKNGINMVAAKASSMDDTDVGGAVAADMTKGVARKLSTVEFDSLDNPNSILFLDEINRAPSTVLGTLLTLISDHIIEDNRSASKERFFPNFLFTAAAMNPPTEDYAGTDELDTAMKGRFMNVNITADPKATLQYFTKKYQGEIDDADNDEERKEAMGRLGIAQALLSSKNFKFDSAQDTIHDKSIAAWNGLRFSPRDLDALLDYCDGTKDDFLDNWDYRTNNLRKPMADDILKNYEDVDDKANAALAGHDTESLFAKKLSPQDKMKARLAARKKAA